MKDELNFEVGKSYYRKIGIHGTVKFVEFWGNLFVELAEPKHMHGGWSLIMMPRVV